MIKNNQKKKTKNPKDANGGKIPKQENCKKWQKSEN